MNFTRYWLRLCCCFLLLSAVYLPNAWSQNPRYHSLDDRPGLPSTYIYNLAQDRYGSLWMGTNAGLYEYDGINYREYKSPKQQAKSIAGLVFSLSGRLYVYNFQGQLFYVENTQLHAVDYAFDKIYYLVQAAKGGILISHSNGLAWFDERNQTVTPYFGATPAVARAATLSPKGRLYYLQDNTIKWTEAHKSGKFELPHPLQLEADRCLLETVDEDLYLFTMEDPVGYRLHNSTFKKLDNPELLKLLKGRKLTNIRYLKDGFLWIYSYTGVIRYDVNTEKVELWYEEKAISDGILDREGNYWFSIFNEGAYRIPNMEVRVWDKTNPKFQNDQIIDLVESPNGLHLAHLTGEVTRLHGDPLKMERFTTDKKADIQSFDWNPVEKELLLNQNNVMYRYKNGQWSSLVSPVNAVKSSLRLDHAILYATSSGLYLQESNRLDTLYRGWSRKIVTDTLGHRIWVATNTGLLKLRKSENKWSIEAHILKNTQLIDITLDAVSSLYLLDFSGRIYAYNSFDKLKQVAQLPEQVLGYRLRFLRNKLYVATNKGVYIYDMSKQKWTNLSQKDHLISNNVYDIAFYQFGMWLATSKGVQRLPIDLPALPPKAQLILRDSVGGIIDPTLTYKHAYHTPLQFYPHLAHFSSNSDFHYAYRILPRDTVWTYLPASTQVINLTQPPIGDCQIELKAVDYLGRDSENRYVLQYTITPPFWRTGYFYTALVVIIGYLIYLLYQRYRSLQQQRQNQLNTIQLAQLQVLKSRINPELFLDMLREIDQRLKASEYTQAQTYIGQLSELLRHNIALSKSPTITLREELEQIENYLLLEQLRYPGALHFVLHGDRYSSIRIPTLLIIPIIEEIIQRNRVSKNSYLTLTIEFTRYEFLECRITDNGIAPEEICDQAVLARQDALQQRIRLLQEIQPGNYTLLYKSLHQNGKKSGVQTILRLPFEVDLTTQTNPTLSAEI